MRAPVVSRAFLCALVAVPVAALAACSVAAERPEYEDKFSEEEVDAGSGATTSRADDGGGPPITGETPAPVDPNPEGSEIDLTKVEPCDTDLAVDGDAAEFLKAIGLCKRAEEDSEEWGVIDAKFTKKIDSNTINENSGQHGILEKFGDIVAPREGTRLGVLSTGWAREYNSENGTSGPFTGSGKSWPGSSGNQRDVIVLAIKLRVPLNAKSFSFDFNFHSGEWPTFVGLTYNDQFTANLDGDNISFDANNKPVSVNNNFFDRCTPNVTTPKGKSVCAGGPDELNGTGFETSGSRTQGGATGWLTTKSPVEPGSVIELQFGVWDVQDGQYDSLVLIDNFKWDADPVSVGTDRPVN